MAVNDHGQGVVFLYDEAGNAVAVVDDGGTKRLATSADIKSWLGSTAPTVGQKAMVDSVPVAFASDQDALAIYIGAPANSVTGLVTSSISLGGGTANNEQHVALTTYNEQLVNAIRSVVSGSANDAAAGTGARSIRITYYDAVLAGPFTTDVIMDGTNPVALSVSDVCFVERMDVLTVGSLGWNDDVITLYVNNVGGGGVIGSIGYEGLTTGQGDNRTFWGHHYIADGCVATFATFVTSADSGGAATAAEFYMKVRNPLEADSPDVVGSDLLLATGVIVRQLAFPIKITGPAVVTIFAVPFVNNAHLNASFDYSEVVL
jgi:hypothetical protein